MKYAVFIIGESGKYETVARGISGGLAGAIKKRYIKSGVWAQVKKEDE